MLMTAYDGPNKSQQGVATDRKSEEKTEHQVFIRKSDRCIIEEAHKQSLHSFEHKVVVYGALKHLLTQQIRGRQAFNRS
jgi:hypothetical protein